jgi:predicted nucleic acid-binding Zn ribbon protein
MAARNENDRTGPRPVGGVLTEVVARLGLRRSLDDYRIFEAWDRVVGPQIARHAQPVRLDARRLVIHVHSAVWLQELTLLRDDLRRRINEWMGRELVSELFLVLGPLGDGPNTRSKSNRRSR